MKRIALLVLVLTVAWAPATAQSNGGDEVGLNVGVTSNMYSSESDNEYLACYYACMLEAIFECFICPRGKIGGRLGCWRRGERQVFTDEEYSFYYNYMVLGVTGTFLILTGPCWLGITGGPNLGYLVSRGHKFDVMGNIDKGKDEIQRDGPIQDVPLQVGVNVGVNAGMRVGPGSITGQLGFDFGFTGIASYDNTITNPPAARKHRNFFFSAGYQIPLSAIFGGNDSRGAEE